MTDNIDLTGVPETTIVSKKRMRFSVVWIIPLVAAIVAIGIAVQRIMTEGPTITIVFNNAEGVEAGKTHVKYKEVTIGEVTKVKLSEDFRKVVLTAKIDKSAAGLLVDDARFWIEQPRATLSGISGIGTLLSGNYIGLEPGKSKKERREFTGREVPPQITFDQPGRRFIMETATLGSIGSGSPLYFRQLNVGQVIGYDLSEDGGSVKIEVFVRAPYDKYVTDQTRFWQASGIDVYLDADGFAVRTQSVLSMLIGGIAFEIPPTVEVPKPAVEKAVFHLFDSRKEAMANPETVLAKYVLYFNETLRGVSVGAPVLYIGLPIGEVTDVGFEYNEKTNSVRPRVDIVTYPERFMAHVKKSPKLEERARNQTERQTFMQNAIDRGLRAQLRSGNLLTGQRFIALDHYPNAPKVKIDWTKSPVEMPVVPSGLQDIETKITNILGKIEKIPLDGIGNDVKKLLESIDVLLKRVDGEVVPEVKATLEELKRVLENINTTLVGKDAPTQQQLREALQEITKAAQGISSLTEYLERNPESLIQGKSKEKP
ncbi:MAG TPA: MlaD family protein [Syntrophales bacterium]|nr:MlaD family protein [Syntrophales bacterium]